MQKRKDTSFSEKFRLLNSREHVEEIKWSSSESSDVENVPRDNKFSILNKVHRKRKRNKTEPKNLSNLSITVVDTSKEDHKELNNGKKSPILQIKSEKAVFEKSPTFAPTLTYSRPHKCLKIQQTQTSPVLTYKVSMSTRQSKVLEKSPILMIKHTSPKVSPNKNVRKNLFKEIHNDDNLMGKVQQENTNIIFTASERDNKSLVDRRKSEDVMSIRSESCKFMTPKHKEINQILNTAGNNNNTLMEICDKTDISKHEPSLPFADDVIHYNKIKIEIPDSQEEIPNLSQQILDDTFTLLKTSNTELEKRAKSYFENHFSSGNASQSQHSISDCPTQKNYSKSSDDVEIISITTQINSNRASFQSEHAVSKNPSPVSSQSAEFGIEKSKKMRYKKDGLAYRLNALLKKQNANTSLWQHERFLAENSNFLIPKGEHSVFLIQRVTVRFGCYLLEGIDVSDSNVLILISSIYIQEFNICENMIFKLYEPYRKLEFKENCKLIINVCKFECIAFKE